MINSLKENEGAVDLIENGLSMASVAMGNILQSPISIRKIDYDIHEIEDVLQFSEKKDTQVHVLRTELKGDFEGVCYLILTEEEADKILRACLPASIVDDTSAQNQMMKDGFLTELDNMVAAAVITKFADNLGVMLFGQVPSLSEMKANELNQYIAEDSKAYNAILHFNANLEGEELNISPDFVWVVQQEFIEKAKQAQ